MSELKKKILSYFDNPEVRVLFVFNNPLLSNELKEEEWDENFIYVEFKGDWFTTKYRLENEWSDKKVILYMAMPSPLEVKSNQENFPLMDVLVANVEYHNDDYSSYMQQYGIPSEMATFVERHIQMLQTEKMLKLLRPFYADRSINSDVATRAIISMYFNQSKVLEWDDIIIKMIAIGCSKELKKQIDFYKRLKATPVIEKALENKLVSIFGCSFEENKPGRVGRIVQIIKYNAIVQSLAAVSADNYQSLRIKDSFRIQQINQIVEKAVSSAKTADDFKIAMKELGADVRVEEIVNWYGTSADYAVVTSEMCFCIIRKMIDSDIIDNPDTALSRIEGLAIRQFNDEDVSSVLDYVLFVSRLMSQIQDIGSITLNTPKDYIERYKNQYFRIDQFYRYAVLAYYNIKPTNELFEQCQELKRNFDREYAKISNRLNVEWLQCVAEKGGFRNIAGLRQWEFFSNVIKPIQKKVAVIVCDALRYELAEDLVQELARSKHIASIDLAISSIPTETKYCKTTLLPFRELGFEKSSGSPAMSVDGVVLDNLQKRSEHVGRYKDGAVCVSYKEVVAYNTDKNREIFKHPLVYIFHDEIDTVGHDGTSKQIVSGCAQAIKDIATLIPKIHTTYNVTEIYVTSDHGFLFNDIDFEDKDKQVVEEASIENKSRYYLTESDDEVKHIKKFKLCEVSGMTKNVDGVYVAVPEGTNRLAAPAGGYVFTHGGASLQEVLIPIVVSHLEREDNKQSVNVMLLNKNISIVASRLRCTLLQTEAVSMETKARIVKVALYVNNDIVSSVQTIALDKTDPLLDARKFQVDIMLNKDISAKVMQLRVYDEDDMLNPLIRENVTNNTLIGNDFDF